MSDSGSEDDDRKRHLEAKKPTTHRRGDKPCNAGFLTQSIVEGRMKNMTSREFIFPLPDVVELPVDGVKVLEVNSPRTSKRKRLENAEKREREKEEEFERALVVRPANPSKKKKAEDDYTAIPDAQEHYQETKDKAMDAVYARMTTGIHSLGAIVVRIRDNESRLLARRSVSLRTDSDHMQVAMAPITVSDIMASSQVLTKCELAHRMAVGEARMGAAQERMGDIPDMDMITKFGRRQMLPVALGTEQVVRAYGEMPHVLYINLLAKMLAEENVWDHRFNGGGSRVQDGRLLPRAAPPDLGTPLTIPFINSYLRPYVASDKFTKPCGRREMCRKRGATTPGATLASSRVDQHAEYCALIPPDVLNAWTANGVEPEDNEWLCFYCELDRTERAFLLFEQHALNAAYTLNRFEVALDQTGVHGFPPHILFRQVEDSGRVTGISGNFPRLSMVLDVQLSGGRTALADADFPSSSATSNTV